MLLRRNDAVTIIIVKQYHKKGSHFAGINQTLSALSSKVWTISAREEIRNWERLFWM